VSAPRVTPSVLRGKKSRGQKITMLTAYDFPMASFIEQAGVDIVLVSQMLHHLDAASSVRLLADCHAIARRGVVIADLRPSPLAAVGYRLVGPFMRMHPMTVRDGVTSLQRGLTPAVLQRLVHQAIGRDVPVWRRPGARVLATWRTDR